MTRKGAYWFAAIVIVIALAIIVPQVRAAAALVVGFLYNLFALLIVGSFFALFAWYIFGILLPGLIRYRKLRQIRYYREVKRRRRWDYEDR